MTITDICNVGLAALGEAQIFDYHENTALGEMVRTNYPLQRDALLQTHLWKFARGRERLSATTAPAFGWKFAYQLPVDCIRPWSVNGIEAKQATPNWEIEGQTIITDVTQCNLVYIRRLTNNDDVALWSPMFVQALAIRLAVSMCLQITNSQEKKAALQQELEGLRSEAGWLDAVSSRPTIISPTSGSRLIAARMGGYPMDS